MLRWSARKVIRHLATCGVAVLTFQRYAEAQYQGLRVARGTSQLRACASESPDLRNFSTSVARAFGQLFGAQQAEVELHASEQAGVISARWAATKGATPSPEGSIVLPLVGTRGQIGLLRLHRAGGPFTGAETRELNLLAKEAGRLTENALKGVRAAEPIVTGERLRIAAQIHHGVAQYLANALMRLQLSQRYAIEDPERFQESLHNSLTYAQMAMDAVRATIRSLSYPEANSPRIAPLLEAMTERLRAFTAAEFHLDVADVGSMSPAIEAVIGVVASEAMTNAAKHANANRIYVGLSKKHETIVLEVHDDGVGFAYQERAPRAGDWEQFGLLLMREQVGQVGGTLEIQSVPSQGAIVRAHFPSRLQRRALSRETGNSEASGESEVIGASE